MRDEEGFREFVDARYPELLRIGWHLTGSAHEAEDLVQAALVRVMGRWRRVDDPLAYVRRVMVNHHAGLWRRYRSREVTTDRLPELAVGDDAEAAGDRDAIYRAMRALAPRTRAVIVLRYVADLPEAEVAGILGCAVGSVKSRASRGLAQLRSALGAPSPAATTQTRGMR